MKKKNIIKITIGLVIISGASIGFCSFLEEIKQKLQSQFLDPLAKDMVGITCVNILNRGDGLGLFTAVPPSAGVNVRAYAAFKKIATDNIILKNLPKETGYEYIVMPVIQLEKGLPFNIDVIARGVSVPGITFYGIGLKYCVFDSIIPGVPDISVGGIVNKLIAMDVMTVDATSLNIIASIGLPVIKPYVIIGLDSGNMEMADKVVADAGLSALGKLKGKFSSGTRFEVGLNLSPLPFIYLNATYSKVYNDDGLSVGLGVNF